MVVKMLQQKSKKEAAASFQQTKRTQLQTMLLF